MKRDPRLATLSREHHHALVIAQILKRTLPETAGVARQAFLAFWEEDGRAHFRLEEELLLPGYARHGDTRHPLVVRTLCEHVEIRRLADDLARDPVTPVLVLQELGSRLTDHVRMEERELFPLIEEAMPEDALTELAEALQRAEDALNG
jgi:hemerythrin-like domain-containing protein